MRAAPTEQQMKVAALVSRGLLNKQIAHELQIVEGTVKTHIQELAKRIGISGAGARVRITLWYLRQCDPAERDAIIAGRAA